MQQIRQARIPVDLNAVLIGKKAVPKGCKVRNVSSHGLLLQCDADGRILTFSDGDHVDIHILFHRPNGTKYHTVAADVRHVDATGIGVEFCQPDAELVKLIESYRVDGTRSIEATITHRSRMAGPERSASVVVMPTPRSPAHAGPQRLVNDAHGKHLSYISLVSLVIAVIIIVAGYLRTFDLDSRVSRLESLVNAQNNTLAGLQAYARTPVNSASIGAEGNRSTGSAVALAAESDESAGASAMWETSNASAMTVDMQPFGPAAAGQSDLEASHAAASEKPAGLTDSHAPVDGENLDVRNQGPWVINLMSSPNPSDADRFADNAKKKGIQVRQTSARLNGKEFFRVQLTGFASEEQARASAGPVQEQLGLKDVWIFKP